MPDKTGRLTPMEGTFARVFGQTGDATYAATKAGYADPVVAGSKKSRDPAVQAAARASMRDKLADAAPRAVAVLDEIMSDAKQPSGQRVNAADKILKHFRETTDGPEGRDMHEMTPEELASMLAAGEVWREELMRHASDQARVIELEPNPDDGVFG